MSDPITFEKTIPASRWAIFQYFTDPARMEMWLGIRCTAIPEAGGAYSIQRKKDEVVSGAYEVYEEPARVAFTWGWEGSDDAPPGCSRVEVQLEDAPGGTRILLTHSGLPPARAEKLRGTWERTLDKLDWLHAESTATTKVD